MTQRPPRYEPTCPINAIGEGATPLMYACQQARDAEVRSILANKPGTVLERDRTRKTPLHYCAENSSTACAELLLNASPSLLDERDEDGYTALHLGVIAGNRPLIKLLLSRGANVNSLDNERHSVVHWATVCGEVEALELVLDAGADPSTPDIHGGYPIHYAAQMCGPNSEMGNDVRFGLAVLRKLLARGVAVDVADQDGRQPILWAASADSRSSASCPSGSADAILALVNAGANVEADDKDGLTALHCAASRGHTDCLETLVTLCGAEVDVIDSNGCTALFYSVTLGHADSTRLLLGYGAEPNRQDRKGRTPAHCGAAKGQLETLRILGSHGANLWVRNVKGDYPLHEAVASGRKDLVRWLLNQRPDAVNSPNNDGRCPLHIAAINNNMEMCKIVLDYQALLNSVMRTSKGQLMTPMDAALHRGNRGCAKYLQLHGGVPASKLTDKAAKIKGGSHRQTVSESQSEPYTTPDCVQTIPLPRGGMSLASSPMGELLHDARHSESRTLQVRLNDDVAIRHVERIDPPVVCRHRTYDDDSSEEERLRRRRRRRRREHRRMEYSLDRDSDITDEEARRRRRHGRRRREPSDTDSEEQRHSRRRRRGRTRSSEDSDSENERVRYKRRSRVSYQDSDSEHRRSTRSRSSKRKTKKNESDNEEEDDDEEEELAQQDEDEAESSSADIEKRKVHDRRHIEKTETQKKSKTVNNQTSKKKQEKKQKTSKEGVSSDRRSKKEVIKESQEKEIKVRKTKSKVSDSRTKVTETDTHHSEAEVEEKTESLSKQSSEGGTRSSHEDANGVIVTHQVVTALVHREEHHSRSEREEGSGSLSAKEEGSSKHDTDLSKGQGEELDERKSNGQGSLDKISTVHSSDPEKDLEDKIADNETNQEPDNDIVCAKDSTESEKDKENDLTLEDDEKQQQNESSHDDASEEQKTALSKSKDNSPGEVTVDQHVMKSNEGGNVDEHTEEQQQEDSIRHIAEVSREESKSNEDEEGVDHAISSDKDAVYDAEREMSAEEVSKAISSGERESNEEKVLGAELECVSRKETESECTENVSEKELDIVRKSSKSDQDKAGVEDSVTPDEGVQDEEGGSELGGEKFDEDKSTEDGKEQIVTDEEEIIKPESLEKDKGDSDDFEDDLEGEQEDEGEEEEEEKQAGVEDEEDEDGLDEDDTKLDTNDSISIKQQDSLEQASMSSKDEETILKPALSGREERRKASQDQHKPHDSGGEHERADNESESEVQELDKDSTERTLSSRSRNGDSGFEPSPRRDKPEKPMRARSQPHGRIPRPCRDGVSDDERPDISTVSVTQAVQNSMRKYHMERRIFQQLLELKRLQIRAGRANENVLVKRLVDDYRRAGLIVGLRHYDGPYTFRSFEKYLYDQLRLLQTSERRMVPRLQSSDDLDKLHAVLRRARLNNKLLGDIPDNPVLCTQGTHRCHHAAHAYTGVPCAAYITKPNHHHKQSPPKSGGFLPRIDSTSSRGATRSLRYVDPAKPVTLELSHGNDKQVISLPTEKLDKNKRYYVTFTIKGGQNGKDEAKVQEEEANMRHRHAKSL
ncbi:uncharacterized protein [Anabrus simplex]|uniref:uncharacterized protein n=1 Tax=Anabrus simplex TaxID=316456 RepID=UPI0035A3A87B